jgi:hypothetical protein
MSLTKDQERVEMEVTRATSMAGRKFISLRLLDNTKRRIQGAIVLHATPYIDGTTNMKQFHFEEQGGPLCFQDDDMRGGVYCRMLDCEHNRKFLASMISYKFWIIEDETVLADIVERAEKITKNAIITRPNEAKETRMSDAEIETEMARLQAESSKRKVAKADGNKRKPTKTAPVLPGDSESEELTGPGLPENEVAHESAIQETPEPESDSNNAGKHPGRKKSALVSIGG